MVQLSGFGKPKTIKVKRILTRDHREKLENFEKRKELLYPKSFNKTFKRKSKLVNSLKSNSLKSNSLNVNQLKEMKYPTLVDHVYRCIEKAEQSLSDLEVLLAFSSVAGFQVPTEAQLAFKVSRGFLKLAKTKKVNFVDAVVDGIGLSVPSARLAGYTQHPVLDRGARLLQLGIKKIIKGESVKSINALTAYSAIIPSITSRKIGASTAGSLARQLVAVNSLIPKSKKSNKKP